MIIYRVRTERSPKSLPVVLVCQLLGMYQRRLHCMLASVTVNVCEGHLSLPQSRLALRAGAWQLRQITVMADLLAELANTEEA